MTSITDAPTTHNSYLGKIREVLAAEPSLSIAGLEGLYREPGFALRREALANHENQFLDAVHFINQFCEPSKEHRHLSSFWLGKAGVKNGVFVLAALCPRFNMRLRQD